MHTVDGGGWCESGDDGEAAGDSLQLDLSPAAAVSPAGAAHSPASADTVATPPGLLPIVITPPVR